jgi:polysaccharide export outer membrane protein
VNKFALLIFLALGNAHLLAQTALVTLRPGDTFEMRLGAVPLELAQEFNSTYNVSQEGTVNIPLIGETRVAGLTPPQVEKTVQNKLIADKLFTHPSVNIIPVANSRMVTIGGGVRAPQRLPWSADLTLGSAIQIAGGYSDWGSPKAVRLIRNGQQEVFDARKFDKNPSLDPKLLPGDQIVVPQ